MYVIIGAATGRPARDKFDREREREWERERERGAKL